MKKIDLVFGTRPEAIKMAPLALAFLDRQDEFQTRIILTAQHRRMLDQVMNIFGIAPDIDLDIMTHGQTLTEVTTRGLTRLDAVFSETPPDLVLVHGDTTTTLAATLAAFYHHIPVGHVEAGLRSGDMDNPWPEEMNRRLCDAACALHFAPTATARYNLEREGIGGESIFVTGNTGIDALQIASDRMRAGAFPPILAEVKEAASAPFVLITAHRRENHGQPLANLCDAVAALARERAGLRFIYPVHLSPSIREPVHARLGDIDNVYLLPPLDYGDFVFLMQRCLFAVTDSGGVQEEAPSLGKPVLVLRKVTERPEAVHAGTVRVVGTDASRIVTSIQVLLDDRSTYERMANSVNPYGDGAAASRTVKAVQFFFGHSSVRPKEFVS